MPAGKTQDTVAENVAEAAGAGPDKGGWSVWALALTLLALFVLPIMAGNYLATAWKMPDHGWKISLTLGVLAGSFSRLLFRQVQGRSRPGGRDHVDL